MSAPQIVCPVCHTQQDNAWDCVVCGASLHDRPKHWAVPVQQVEGLETTRLDEAGNVALDRMPGLELTSVDDGIEPLPDGLEGLEPTHFETQDVPVQTEPVPAFEATALDEKVAAPVPAAIACRYCGTSWQQGMSVFCGRCGMRVGAAPGAAAKRLTAADGDLATCRGCGLPEQRVGSLCGSCQQPVIGA